MLLLTRYPGQEILIGDDIKLMVIAYGPKGARIGIEAPKDVKILRSELLERDKNAQSDESCEADGNI